jgi:DNA-binding response OmpR family regulator
LLAVFVASLTTESLTDAGLDVVAAIDGSQALRTALARKPAAVVLDIGPPDFDGTQSSRGGASGDRMPTKCRS